MKSYVAIAVGAFAISTALGHPLVERRAARSVDIDFQNKVSYGVWNRNSWSISSGEGSPDPPMTLCVPDAGSSCTDSWVLQSNSFMHGAIGTVGYVNDKTGVQIKVTVSDPYFGGNFASVEFDGNEAAGQGNYVDVDLFIGTGQNVGATFTIYNTQEDNEP